MSCVVQQVLTTHGDSVESICAVSTESPPQVVEQFVRRVFIGTVAELDSLVSNRNLMLLNIFQLQVVLLYISNYNIS